MKRQTIIIFGHIPELIIRFDEQIFNVRNIKK